LYGVKPDSRVKYSDVNWKQVTRFKKNAIEMLGRKDREKAVKSFSDGLKIVPRHGLMLSFIGQMYLEKNQPKDAEIAFRRLINDEPNDASLYNYLATALEQQGRGKDALNAYRQALSFDADSEEALQGAARILATHPSEQLRDPAEALKLAERANALSNGQNPISLRVLGAAYAATRQFDIAQQKVGQAILMARAANDEAFGKAARSELVLYEQQRPAINSSLVQ
jgi:tetratricopeptide (TPR) repeat protein